MTARDALVLGFRQLGLASGDTVLVHSSMKSLGFVEGGAESVVAALLEVLGEPGTLIVPTFNFGFCSGDEFDVKKTPSKMGLISEHVRTREGSRRIFHPIYSFSLIGHRADELSRIRNRSSYGRDSLFGRLRELNGKIMLIGVSYQDSMTFFHHVEEMVGCDYRFFKEFKGRVSEEDGSSRIDVYTMFARDIERGVVTFVEPVGELLDQSGLVRIGQVGDACVRLMEAQRVFEFTVARMKENPRVMYDTKGGDLTSMESGRRMKSLVTELWPLHRTLVSDGTDQALEIIGRELSSRCSYVIESYPSGKEVWTWWVPDRYLVREAFIETGDGRRIADFNVNPLHLVSYSEPVDLWLDWNDLASHLHISNKRHSAIPWEFKYYERSWGFCISKETFDSLSRASRYHAVVDAEFIRDKSEGLKVGVGLVGSSSQNNREILLCAHVCHPFQANDDLSGVATIVEVARRLKEKPLPNGSRKIRMLFCPETIGSVCYFAHNEPLVQRIDGSIFCEMTGNRNSLVLQRSRQSDSQMDRIAKYVLLSTGNEFREGQFREVVCNDEMVINGPGVDIPCISISRWPYAEYHTSDDNPSIVHEEMLDDSANVVEEIVRIAATNYRPMRRFRGPVFLSRYGLWVDWRVNKRLNRALDAIMLKMEGNHTILDISLEVGLDYWTTREYLERFREKGLIDAVY